MSNWKKSIGVHGAWFVVCAILVASTVALSTRNDGPLTRKTFVNVAKKTLPAVVSITVNYQYSADEARGTLRGLFEQRGFQLPEGFEDRIFPGLPGENLEEDEEGNKWMPVSGGSGAIIRPNGYMVTNRHVVMAAIDNDKVDLIVETDHGKTFSTQNETLEIVNVDNLRDLAVLKAKTDEDLPYLEWGDSKELEIGEWVLAVGNPLDLEGTASQGIVSQKHRKIQKAAVEDLLQITAMINPGNSGGALVNLDGKLVGINMAIATNTGRWQGVGFAIPSEHAKWVSDSIIEHGRLKQGYMGVQMSEDSISRMTSRAAAYYGLPERGGVIIEDVPEGRPADKAGLQKGDVIVEIHDGDTVFDININSDLLSAIASRPVGTTVDVLYYRDGEKETTKLTVEERPETDELTEVMREDEVRRGVIRPLGIQIQKQEDDAQGLKILQVDPNGPAAEAEPAALKANDVILEIDDQVVNSAEEAIKVLETRGRDGMHKIRFQRGQLESATYVTIENDE